MQMRIPQSFIDELLTRTDIVSLIEPLVPLKKAGSNFVACCPFHQEKTPSFTVSPSKQIYHCFGCGVGGNAISFLMEYEHLSFMDAIETLASHTGMQLPTHPDKTTTTQTTTNSNVLYEIMEKAASFYQTCLAQGAQATIAKTYLRERGLTQEIIQRFKIGYAPPGWDNLLRHLGKRQQQSLLTTGMLVQKDTSSTYDRFRNRIMFPIIDRRGRIVAFGGRVIDANDTPKYLNSPETPIFHKSKELYGLHAACRNNRNLTKLLLVEGYMDVIALAQHGINYAVATLGTAITNDHILRLFRTCPEIIFCFDGDNAGRTAAWRTLTIILPLLHDNWQAKFTFLPDGEDPDSLIQKLGKDKFETLIQNADPLSTFFFSQLSKQVDLQQADGRAHLVSLAMPHLQNISAEIIKEMMLAELAQQVNMHPDTLNKFATKPYYRKSQRQSEPTSKRQVSPIGTAISLLLQNPPLINEIKEEFPDAAIRGMPILRKLCHLLQTSPHLTTGNILEHYRESPEYPHLVKLACQKPLLNQQNLAVEFRDVVRKIRLQAIEYTIEILMSKANAAKLTAEEKQLLQQLLQKTRNANQE